MARSARGAAGLVGALAAALLLTGCPSGTPDDARPDATATATATATPARPDGDGPLPAVPDGGEPVAVLGRAVELTSAESAEVALEVVAAPGGAAHVLMGEPPLGPVTRLLTVSPRGEVTGSVPVPGLATAWDLHLLPDREVLVSGRLADGGALGYLRLDLATGAVRAVRAVPLDEETERTEGFSAISDDGATVFLYAGTRVGGRYSELLEAWDLGTDELLAARDLFADMRTISLTGFEPDPVGLVPWAGDGVALVTNAWRGSNSAGYVPMLLTFDPALEPAGGPLDLVPRQSAVTARAITTGSDGGLFVLLRGAPASTVLTVDRDDRTPVARIAVPGFGFTDHLAVDGDGTRAFLPGLTGARVIDLADGRTTPVDVGCPAVTTVLALAGAAGGGALVLGQCPGDGRATPTLWFVG